MKVLLTASQRGSVNVLAPVARELLKRNHNITIYATGNNSEAAGFTGLDYNHIQPTEDDYKRLVECFDAVIVGQSGYDSPDTLFLKAANSKHIPTISVADQNAGYKARLGNNIDDLPVLLAVMSSDCIKTLKNDLEGEMGEEAARRSKVVGWTAFDNYAEIRDSFSETDRDNLLKRLKIDSDADVYVHFTQNIHPSSDYIVKKDLSFEDYAVNFNYEMRVTRFVFEFASDLGLKLLVKPHPGELYKTNFTKELSDRHGFKFIDATACDSKELMLSAYSVTAGRSTCLTESTLLDKNTGGFIPDMADWIDAFPPLKLDAIPYATDWEKIKDVLEKVTSKDNDVLKELSENRKKFSVDGKASERLVDLIEDLK